jgi:hypothetical protein
MALPEAAKNILPMPAISFSYTQMDGHELVGKGSMMDI